MLHARSFHVIFSHTNELWESWRNQGKSIAIRIPDYSVFYVAVVALTSIQNLLSLDSSVGRQTCWIASHWVFFSVEQSFTKYGLKPMSQQFMLCMEDLLGTREYPLFIVMQVLYHWETLLSAMLCSETGTISRNKSSEHFRPAFTLFCLEFHIPLWTNSGILLPHHNEMGLCGSSGILDT